MKILFVVNGYPTKTNPDYCIFNKEQIDALTECENISGDVIFINAREKGKFEYLKGIKLIKNLSREYDAIHTFHGLSYISCLIANPRTPIVVSFLNELENEYLESRRLSKVLTVATKALLWLNKTPSIFKGRIPGNARNPVYSVPNGVNTNNFSIRNRKESCEVLGLDPDCKYVLFVSSKNLYRAQKRYDICEKVMTQISAMGRNDIKLLTMVNVERELIPYYFNASSVHLLTSDFEGSPNSVKEALSCGVPVVARNAGNTFDMIKGVPGCKQIESDDPLEIAKHCIAVIDQDWDRDAIRKSIFQKGLDLENSLRKIIKIYNLTIQAYQK